MRFFVSELARSGSVILDGGEAHHALHVLRLGVGAEVELFDGAGTVATAEVAETSRKDVSLTIRERRTVPPPRAASVRVVVAPPKGDRLRWMIEKLTELGVGETLFLDTERTVTITKAELAPKKIDKLRQTAVAAAKQCGQNHLPRIGETVDFAGYCEQAAADDSRRVVIGDLAGSPNGLAELAEPEGLDIVIGPEGDFTDAERERLRSLNAIPLRFAETVLRVETAAVSLAAIAVALRMPSG